MGIESTLKRIEFMSSNELAKLKNNAERLLANGSEQQRQDAQIILDAMTASQEAKVQQVYDRYSDMTINQRVISSFSEKPASETEALVIKTLMKNPGSTSQELSKACGWKAQTWHLWFGTMCAERQAELWPAPPSESRPDKKFMTGILADLSADNRFTMKPDVASAFEALGLAS
ncbi:hypothetical protein [Ponticaulis sp.]|uniref:hypothetical protein n=1 Tax=Ponticaulis sp. TaxID=2020902 RepID=UPI000B67F365|nr:hypothetical protein [Ponticaulis sp.]MAI89315.1 hypothetical protein [Ponticaulis sp.]OUY01295.1 MAG: hypothetical protein CBB65_02370 [Hyphomonadaceae bacterium TMED5]|tara:strand:- start:46846 stop:47367 length:522 start_codon:yes stop_codon:yes gene_type:complete